MSATGREVPQLSSRSAHRQRANGSFSGSREESAVDRRINVLLADDDDGPRERLATALRHAGIEVTEARDGDEARLLAARAAQDVIVLGWPMASGGLSLAERLIGEYGMTGRVIMLAAAYDSRDHHAALKAGARYTVRGPAPELLVAAIQGAASRTVPS